MTLVEFLAKLDHVQRAGDNKYTAACPAHDDRSHDSLSICASDTGGILLHCFADCPVEAVVAKLRLEMRDLFEAPHSHLRQKKRTASPPADVGLTLAAYADAKRLPIAALKCWGLTDRKHSWYGQCVQIPFTDEDGDVVSVLYRLSLTGGSRMKWRRGDHLIPYGLSRLKDARALGSIVLVEGPSDTQTLWHHGIPALGLPSNLWNDDWARYLDGFDTIFVVIEPGQSGEGMLKSAAASRLRDRFRLVSCAPYKDPNAMHLANPDAFHVVWQLALDAARSWTTVEAEEAAVREAAAAEACGRLARSPRILPCAVAAVRALGVVRERRVVELLTLAVVSRLLDTPVSVALKGPSAAGKSFVVERVLRLFPPSAAHALTAMSERALAYDTEPLVHRMLVLYEAAGCGATLRATSCGPCFPRGDCTT
jgi:hypothetical protein